MQSGEVAQRRVDPYQLLYQGGQFYLVGYSHERDDVRVFRLSRIRGKVAYATKAEHDFQRPPDFDPRVYANRIRWQLGEHAVGTAEIWVSDRIAWHVERNFGPYGEIGRRGGRPRLPYAVLIPASSSRGRSGYGEHARIVGPPELAAEARERLDAIIERHRGEPFTSVAEATRRAPTSPRTPSRPAARARRPRSAPSASPASSRSPRS